ncbi:MAG: hypothetical protein ACKOU7_02760, partial [Ferruginibacter sp.]
MKAIYLAVMFMIISANSNTVKAQILNPGKVLERKAINKTNQAINKKADEVIDSAFGKSNDQKPADNKPVARQKNKKDTVITPLANDPVSLQAFSKYDFVPGEKVILFDDFSQDAVGDFPALWTANAAGEINTLSIAPGKWLNLNSTDGNYFYLKNISFPINYIIEFDIVPKKTGGRIAAGLILYEEAKHIEMDNSPHPGKTGIIISVEKNNWVTSAYKAGEPAMITGSSALNPVEAEKVNHVIIWVQNR